MNFKGTQSEINVKAAFAGESQARNKYTYFAAEARKEGQEDIAILFEKMADNEREHAKIWFKLLNDGFGDVATNLQDAAKGENYEWTSMYPQFAEQARADGLELLATMFERVSAIETDHERRFLETLIAFKTKQSNTKTSTAPKQTTSAGQPVQAGKPYRCMFCGHSEATRPDVCPVCEAIGSFESVKN